MFEELKKRFCDNMDRHAEVKWEDVEALLTKDTEALKKLSAMEESGGEPDTIGADETSGRLIFCDCSKETPSGRRSLCYDDTALAARKKNPPKGSAKAQAEKMGICLMDEKMYRKLQSLGEYDCKTSSWINTPDRIREKGGALFSERRYGEVFTFHNGADSYYSVRGWRGFFLL